MRKLLLIITLGIIVFPLATFAGTYGSLKGKVIRDDDGKPVMGASVRVEGTKLGAVAKAEGKFTVASIPPGEYNIKVTSVGYSVLIIKNVKISADNTTEITAKLVDSAKTTKTVVVTAEKNKLVDAKNIGVNRQLDKEALTHVAREGLGSVGLSAGVFNAGDGFNIHGSRSNENSIKLDGQEISNPFTGSFGIGGNAYYPGISSFATEEVQVLTGNQSAEYGNTMGGVINQIPKSGKNDRYEGQLRWRTDVPFLFGRQAAGLKIVNNGDNLKAIDYGQGYKLLGQDANQFDAGFGGPIPYLNDVFNKATFYLSGKYYFEQYRGASYDIHDIAGNSLGQLPNNRSWVKNITARLSFGLSKEIDVVMGGSFGMSNYEIFSSGWMYDNSYGLLPHNVNGITLYDTLNIPENIAKEPVANQTNSSLMARIHHMLTTSSFYEFTVSYTTNNDDWGRRVGYSDPGFFSGFDILLPHDNYAAIGSELVKNQSDKALDEFQELFATGKTSDGYLITDIPQRNPLTGYYEGPSNASSTDNPYGLSYFFYQHGNASAVRFRRGAWWELIGNYQNLFETGEFNHTFKAGFESRIYEVKYHANYSPWDGSPYYTVYSDEWGGNIYAFNQITYEKTSKPYKPYNIAAYAQDQIGFKGIIFSPGLRIDYFNPNSDYRLNTSKFTSIAADTGFARASGKLQVSPRLSVSYPVTDHSHFALSYGIFYRMPEMEYLYDFFGLDQFKGGTLGDPNIDAQRSNEYSISYGHELNEDFSFDITAYYKDIYNQLGVKYVAVTPLPYWQYTVADYGNARGLEFTFKKRAVDHIGFDLNYTLSSAAGTSSLYGVAGAIDPYTGLPTFPLAEFPAGYDRTHRINFILEFVWSKDEGPSIGGIKPLENTFFNFSTFYQSGYPYTRTNAKGQAVSEYNSERHPSIWSTTLRAQKSFELKNWFGESMGDSKLAFFVDINNLFNITSANFLNPRTNDPIDDGQNLYLKEGDFTPTPYYKTASYGTPASYSSDQYDKYGQRLYNKNADLDGNSIVTSAERYSRFVDYLQMALAFRGNFQAPRSVFAGIMINF